MWLNASKHQRIITIVLFYYGTIIATTSSSTTTQAYYDTNSSPDVQECSLWIAPSTIPGAGLGLFAGQPFREQDIVTPGDLTVPLLDMHWHNGVDSFDHTQQFIWDEYTWADHSFARMEQEGTEVFGASFGIGALPNCLFPLIKVDESLNLFDTARLSRNRHDPGVGAFTPYHDRYGYAVEDIVEGQEIFVDYGQDYFLQETRMEAIGIVPFDDSFDFADDLIEAYVEQFLSSNHTSSSQQQQHHHLSSTVVLHDLYEFIRTNVSNTWQSRTLKALPELPPNDEKFIPALNELRDHGTGRVNEQRSIRSLTWLREHGTCAGNLDIRPSTVKQAGRGAFARQAIPAGHVVAAVPLLHIPDRSIMKMHDIRSANNGGPIVHQQLLLNYCFGRGGDSSLLLCPYGVATSAINHAAKPNVRIQWSSKLTLHPEWRDMPVEAWAYHYTGGLAFEYIALRDIAEGEEVFLDYGPSWVAAWKHHVAHWKPKDTIKYVMQDELNQDWDSLLPTVADGDNIRTRRVELRCRDEYRQMRGLRASEVEHHRCQIRLRTADLRYVAEIVVWSEQPSTETCFLRVKEVLFDLPRDAFFYRDLPYTRDHAQYWSFRHEMEIPDELFPSVWKNRL